MFALVSGLTRGRCVASGRFHRASIAREFSVLGLVSRDGEVGSLAEGYGVHRVEGVVDAVVVAGQEESVAGGRSCSRHSLG